MSFIDYNHFIYPYKGVIGLVLKSYIIFVFFLKIVFSIEISQIQNYPLASGYVARIRPMRKTNFTSW